MNKSKFLKRPLAALLAILMVVALVPMSALAEDENVGQELNITVDTYRATRNSDGNYEVTVYDSNDVTIAWAPIPGTTLKLVTRGENPAVLDLPYKLYLAKNAEVTGDNVYTVTLREKVGDAEPVDHDLIITVESTIPENDATLSTVRVENAEGTYAFGYLDEIKAHAISGDINGSDIVITLPFGMKPGDVGLGTDISDSTEIFAPTSIRAKSSYTYKPSTQTGTVTVTAKTGTQDFYNVSFVNEKVFDSFSVNDVYGNQVGVADTSVLDEVTTEKDLPNLSVKVADNTAAWVPTFTSGENVKRIMGVTAAGATFADKNTTDDVELGWSNNSTDGIGECIESMAIPDHLLKVIGSGHATWSVPSTVLLVRTKANPSGAFVKITLENKPVRGEDAIMTEIQVDGSESKWGLTADDASSPINIVVDKTHDFDKGNTQLKPGEHACTVKVTTDAKATVSVPAQNITADGRGTTRHTLNNVNTKSGSFTLRVTAEDGKHYRDYTINLTASKVKTTELNKLELRDGKGNVVAVGVPESKADKTITLKVPYKYGFTETHGVVTNICPALRGLFLYAYPSEGAAVKPGPGVDKVDDWGNQPQIGAPIENTITTMGQVWKPQYTTNLDKSEHFGPEADGSDISFSRFDDTLFLTVSNANGEESVYRVELKQGLPDENAEITKATANRAWDNNYIYSVATTLNQNAAAYMGAVDAMGNNLPVTIESGAIRVDVPYDWKDTDTFYLTNLEFSGEKIYRIRRATDNDADKTSLDVLSDTFFTMNNKVQDNQALTGATGMYNYSSSRGFSNLTTSVANVKSENILYVASEKSYYTVKGTGANDHWGHPDWIKKNADAEYKIYIRRTTKDTGKVLNSIGSDDSNVKVDFNKTYDKVTVTVPGSYNWGDYRHDGSHDFTLKFDASKGAVVIDKGQALVNKTVAEDSIEDGKKYDDERNGTEDPALESDSKAEYNVQMNEHDQWVAGETSFFVLGGELYIYDELTGEQTRVTGEGNSFTNSNWGEIKSKQAEIDVFDAAQESVRTYRLELVVGAKSNANSILSLKVGETAATIDGTNITATLPADSEKEQTLAIEVSPMATVTVNGAAYLNTLPIDLSEPATIVVTAEDGTEATYTLTVTFSDDTPDPEKPSDKYTDLDKVTNDTMRDKVKAAIDMGIMGSTSSTAYVFAPKADIGRKDIAVIIARADLIASSEDIANAEQADEALKAMYTDGKDAFNDLAKCNDVQKAAIRYCAEKEIVKGDGAGFNPDGKLTREEIAVILTNWTKVEVDKNNTENVNKIADWNEISNWAKPYVNAVYANKLMNGKGTGFDPKGTVNREQTASVLVDAFGIIYPEFGN